MYEEGLTMSVSVMNHKKNDSQLYGEKQYYPIAKNTANLSYNWLWDIIAFVCDFIRSESSYCSTVIYYLAKGE